MEPKNTFLKMFFASTLGTLTALVIGSFILFTFLIVSLVSIASQSDATTPIKSNSILKIDIDALSEVEIEDPFDFSLKENDHPHNLPLSSVVNTIAQAKENKDIRGIYINISDIAGGYASLKAVRDALLDFKTSGKFVISYADRYTQKAYYLSSVADKLFVNPMGAISFDGLSQQIMFYKDALQKLGVEMMVFKVGTYKSAVEPYILNEISEPNREQVLSYLGSTWEYILADVSKSRGLSAEELANIANQMPTLLPAGQYIDHKLADALLYADQVKKELCSLVGEKSPKDLHFVTLYDLYAANKGKTFGSKSSNEVAVLFAEGEIVEKQMKQGFSSSSVIDEELADRILELADDEDIKAIVLRVNSPGGSAYTSEQIWHAVVEAQKKKPVVASMGDYAASGGYYISSSADKIIAEPTTLTGSIGIFGMFPNVTGLFKKVGVNLNSVNTATFADFGSMGRPMTTEEKALLQRYINNGYETFLTRVSDGRGKTKEQIDSIAQGRVWTGAQALSIGLVDKLGGLDVAIKEAARLAKLDDYRVKYEKNTFSFIEQLFDSSTRTVGNVLLDRFLTPQERKALEQSRKVRGTVGVQARMPFIEIE